MIGLGAKVGEQCQYSEALCVHFQAQSLFSQTTFSFVHPNRSSTS